MRNPILEGNNSLLAEHQCEGNSICLESHIIGDNGIQEKKNSRLLWFCYQPRLSSGVSINSLPQELIRMILEYLISSEQDLFRFGGVCRSWREMMIVSPMWYRAIHGNPLNLLPQELFTRRKARIDRWIIQQNLIKQEDAKKRLRIWLINGAECCIAITGLAFSVKWKTSLLFYQTIGFISGYLSYIIVIIAMMTERYISEGHVVGAIFYTLLLISLILAHVKTSLPSNASLLWIEVISPFYLIFVLVTLYWMLVMYLVDHYRDRRNAFGYYLCFLIIYLPPLFTLALYCRYLDNHHDHIYNFYHYSDLIYLILPHLFVTLIYFLLYWFGSSSDIYQMIRNYNSVDYDQKKVNTLLTRFVSSMVGIISVVLMVTQSFPSSTNTTLEEYFNCLFYLLLIGESFGTTVLLFPK